MKKSIAEEERSSGRGRMGVFDCVYIGKNRHDKRAVFAGADRNIRMYVTVGETDALLYCE